MTTDEDVLFILDTMAAAGVRAWLDGGWGIDALLEKQTRDHADLDLVLAQEQVAQAVEALMPCGMRVLEDVRPTRLVVGDERRSVDIHPVQFDADGGGWQALPDGRAFRYPPEGFDGMGRVGGHSVHCLTAEAQDLCHRGYEPDEKDMHDMRLLHAHFALPQLWPSTLSQESHP